MMRELKEILNVNSTSYNEDPFNSLNDYHLEGGKESLIL